MASPYDWRAYCPQCQGKGSASACKACEPRYRKELRERRKEILQKKQERQKAAQSDDLDKLVQQIEDGSFRVDQKWLLTELIKQYADPRVKDKLKALQMIAEIGGYNKDTGEEKAMIDSLMDSIDGGE